MNQHPGAAPRSAAQDVDAWCALISNTFVPLAASPVGSDRFNGRLEHVSVDEVKLSIVRAGGQHVQRTPRLIARSPEEHVLASIQLAGIGHVLQNGRTATLSPGAMAF